MNGFLSILFITDIHLNFQNVKALKKWNEANKINFDLCLIGGDTANCDQNDKTHNEYQQQEKSDRILKQLQQIFGCKMYVIPGNHDPLSYNQINHKISQHIESIHSKVINLGENLELIGFGGSVPGYFDKQTTKQVWKGYPYEHNDNLSEHCQSNHLFKSQNYQKQTILLTHCGPFDSQTTIDRRSLDQTIYGGAIYFNNQLKKQNLLIYLHGHVHGGSRFTRINQIPIINPGAFTNGQFGYFTLCRNQQQKKWQYQSFNFVRLPNTFKH